MKKTWTKTALPGRRIGRLLQYTGWQESMNCTNNSYPLRYAARKTTMSTEQDARCRLCGKGQESVAHVLSGCYALAQTKHLARHNAALKILFLEVAKVHNLVEATPPWFSPAQPKAMYESAQMTVYWDVPVPVPVSQSDGCKSEQNRRQVSGPRKQDSHVTGNELPLCREGKAEGGGEDDKVCASADGAKTTAPRIRSRQYYIIIDVLGGYSKGAFLWEKS